MQSLVILPLLAGVVVLCHLVNSAFSTNPCLNAVNIGDYRRSKAFVPTAQDPMLCDANIDETVWYRFDAYTGGKMPESCVTAIHCGTFLPIWMNGVHPTATEPGPKAVDVCAPGWFGVDSCCLWRKSISVHWCQNTTTQREYFVYRLQRPPYCSMSYCAGDGLPCPSGCSWNGVRKNCSCPAYPPMTGSPELKPPRVVTGSTMVRDIYGQSFFPTRFQVDCVIRYPRQTSDDGARFEVVFELNGRNLSRFIVNSINPVATLDESYLIGKLGKQLTCKVSSFWDSSDVGSRYLLSNGHWFGLRPIDNTSAVIRSNVVVKEGEITSLWLQSSFPITTRPCFDVPNIPCPFSSYTFYVRSAENFLKLTDCAMMFSQSSNRSVELKISPVPKWIATPRLRSAIWQLNFETYNSTMMNHMSAMMNHMSPMMNLMSAIGPIEEIGQKLDPIFKDYQIQGINIQLEVANNSKEPPKCQSTGDPHVTTFPNDAGRRTYYHIYGVGDFYLVKLQSRQLEIQVRHIICGPDVSCNCGVIAREGNSIIGITKCNQTSPLLIHYQLDKLSPVGSIQTIQGRWKISLLSGIEIDVNEWNKDYMDVHVTGVRSELDQYEGLCSAAVPERSRCTDQCEQYRVPESHSFFSLKNLPKCDKPYVVPRCICRGKESGERKTEDSIKISCEDPDGDYLLKVDLTRVCSKKKRSADDEYDSSSYDDSISLEDFLYNPNPPPPPVTTPRTTTQDWHRQDTGKYSLSRKEMKGSPSFDSDWVVHSKIGFPGVSGIGNPGGAGIKGDPGPPRDIYPRMFLPSFIGIESTVERRAPTLPPIALGSAEARCRNSLSLSPTYSRCLSKVDTTNLVYTCALDIQSLNDYSPADSIATQFERACLDSIRLSLDSFRSRDMRAFGELKTLLTQVEKLVCPAQCSQKGTCVNGVCQCNTDFMGSDCSLRKGQVPSITRIISPFCDFRRHPCKTINVQATHVTSPENVFCKMRSVSGAVGDTPAVQVSRPIISGGLVLCSLPSLPLPIHKDDHTGQSVTVYSVQVSISNDGQQYSNEQSYTVFDGLCKTCSSSNNSGCQNKANTCSIGGRCFRAGDKCRSDESRTCVPSKCQTKWSGANSVDCRDGIENCV